MTDKEKPVNCFSQKLHCSQAVLAAFAKECGITEEEAFKFGSCFGSGMRKRKVCGAVIGVLMVEEIILAAEAVKRLSKKTKYIRQDDVMNEFGLNASDLDDVEVNLE